MTTNKPPIAAWAPSTALHKLESRHNNAPCILTDGPAEFNDVALVRLADYEALQAECEKLRKDAARYQWLMREGCEWPEEVEFATKYQNKSQIDAAIDAAMQRDNPC